jgi:hypothetical protein
MPVPFTFAVLWCLAGAWSYAQDETPPPVIAAIEIVVEDVFEDRGMTPTFWGYRMANDLHVKTREQVVRRELLFSVGEPADEEVLAQTERNLRALPFFRRTSVETIPADDGRVHVRVTASDAWSTNPELRLEKVGNVWTWAAGVYERNLLGFGKQLRLLHDSGIDRDETFVSYTDPRVLGSRVGTAVLLANASDGHRVQFSAIRPFFAIDTPWSFRFVFEDYDRLDPLYEDGARVDELRHVRRRGEAEVARAIRTTSTSALRVHLGYINADDDIDDGGDVRKFGILRIGLTTLGNDFLKLTHVNRFERPEDINLGNQAGVFFGASTPNLGGEDRVSFFYFVGASRGLRVNRNGFLLANVSWQARHRNEQLENNFASVRFDVVQKLSLRRLILAKALLSYGSNLDPEIQIRLGAESGLRGYPVRQFNGDRSFLVSAEGRWFLADDIASLVSVGVAAFVDSGFAWPEGQPMAWRDMRSNVGVSLLLGSNRVSASRPGVRFDFAYALQPIDGLSPWLVSAGSQIGF